MIAYHGTNERMAKFKMPSIKNIFYVATSPQYATKHAKKLEYFTSDKYVYIVDVNEYSKIADLRKNGNLAWKILHPVILPSLFKKASDKDGYHMFSLAYQLSNLLIKKDAIDDEMKRLKLSSINDVSNSYIKDHVFQSFASYLDKSYGTVSQQDIISIYEYMCNIIKDMKSYDIVFKNGWTCENYVISYFCALLAKAGYAGYCDIEKYENVKSDIFGIFDIDAIVGVFKTPLPSDFIDKYLSKADIKSKKNALAAIDMYKKHHSDVAKISNNDIQIDDELAHINDDVRELLTKVDVINYNTIPKNMAKYVTEIDIPENIKMINNCAFDNCDKLRKIIIPQMTTIDPNAIFWYGNRQVNTTIEEVLFKGRTYKQVKSMPGYPWMLDDVAQRVIKCENDI